MTDPSSSPVLDAPAPARRPPRHVVVRRREILRDPRPVGGAFRSSHAVGPVPFPRAVSRMLDVFCVDTADGVVALTYDDGPHPRDTERILDVLAERGATATFFVLARNARAHPEVVRRIVRDGHELALHGPDHRRILDQPTAVAIAGVRASRAEVEDIGGARIRLYRPPYGRYTLAQARGVRRLGLDTVMWSCDGMDWIDDDVRAIADRALSGVFTGGVLLLHDDRGDPETLQPGQRLPAFDRARLAALVLDGLAGRGIRAMSASELLADRPHVRSFQPARSR
jgi:peptidoglycan-N-acetylglucosamine deacetylase